MSQAAAALAVSRMPISELLLDPKNAREHNPRNIDAIKKSLKKFGQQKPIVVTKQGLIVAGHGTVAAAEDLGWVDIDVVITKLKARDLKAFAIADNRTGDLSGWNMDNLGAALQELREFDFDLNDCGFDPDEIGKLSAIEEPEAPAPAKKGKTKEVSFTANEEGGNGAKPRGVTKELAVLNQPLQFTLNFLNEQQELEFRGLITEYQNTFKPETPAAICIELLKDRFAEYEPAVGAV